MLFTVCYGIGCGAFVALIVLVLINRTPAGFGAWFLFVCVLTMLWSASAAVQTWWSPGIAHSLESVQSAAWLFLITLVLRQRQTSRNRKWGVSRWLSAIAISIGIASIINDIRFVTSTVSPIAFTSSQVLERVIVAVVGILLVENLVRNTPANRKWHVFPLAIAAGGLMAYNLFVFSEAVILKGVSATLIAGRGLVLALMVPFLILTMVRNPDWRIDVHVSRKVVFHTATLTAVGIFLLAAAGVAVLIGRLPGEWAAISEIAFFCGSIAVLTAVLSAGSFRSRVRRLISENFFSTRYDYRLEWMRCISTLSTPMAEEPLSVRAIRALADVVDSPGGALWLEGADGVFRIEKCANLRLNTRALESAEGEFVLRFRQGTAVQEFCSRGSGGDDLPTPAWVLEGSAIWLAVPLVRINQIFGFVVLAPPRVPVTLNWESFDLLLAIGQQVASHLSEERVTRSLLETQAVIDYSKKFAFVAHDVKNVAGQLRMMVANIREFGDHPEFRADLIRAMEGGIHKLGSLLNRLRLDTGQHDLEQVTNPVPVIERVAWELGQGEISIQTQIGTTEEVSVKIGQADLHSVLTHVVTNAIEASRAGDKISVCLQSTDGRALIDVTDAGPGMTPEFIRNGLFVPFKTTKADGHGVGAYQARELLRAASGELEVISERGLGTTMRIVLPCAAHRAATGREWAVGT